MNEIAPCKGCTERYTACHSHCDKHQAWLDRYHAQQKHLELNKHRWGPMWTSNLERRYRSSLKLGVGGRKHGGEQ